MKKLYYWLRDYFAFSNTEMRGVLVLMIGVLLLLLFPRLWASFMGKEYVRLKDDQQMLNELLMAFDTASAQKEKKAYADFSLFKFDPNKADHPSLILLGIPEVISGRIIKYRKKGGVFRIKKDLLKIYGFPQDLYDRLEAYVDLPGARKAPTAVIRKKKIAPFDLNQADTLQLSQLAGIGRVLSGRIVKFRTALGGFYSLSQLEEVYNINETAVAQLGKYTFIAENFVPKKFSINMADIRELSGHPYISYELAKAILNHRKTYGKFTSLEDLKEVHLVDDQLLDRLSPYLTI